jgi:hypothetical protein
MGAFVTVQIHQKLGPNAASYQSKSRLTQHTNSTLSSRQKPSVYRMGSLIGQIKCKRELDRSNPMQNHSLHLVVESKALLLAYVLDAVRHDLPPERLEAELGAPGR